MATSDELQSQKAHIVNRAILWHSNQTDFNKEELLRAIKHLVTMQKPRPAWERIEALVEDSRNSPYNDGWAVLGQLRCHLDDLVLELKEGWSCSGSTQA